MRLDSREDAMMALWAVVRQVGGEVRLPPSFFIRERMKDLTLVTTVDKATGEMIIQAQRLKPKAELRDAAPTPNT